MNKLTTREAAEVLGVSERRIRAMLDQGKFPNAEKFGHIWMIDPADLERAEVRDRKPGKPKKR
ncbi:MAG: helix-turn-helix domain-containing protein [bacterium]